MRKAKIPIEWEDTLYFMDNLTNEEKEFSVTCSGVFNLGDFEDLEVKTKYLNITNLLSQKQLEYLNSKAYEIYERL